MNPAPPSALRHSAELEALQGRFAFRVAARLDEQAQSVPHDLSERLRFARERALERARVARTAEAVTVLTPVILASHGGAATLALGGPPSRSPAWWMKLAGVVPLLALVGGLVLIQQANSRAEIAAAAEIDSALLSDDLPPDAYSDPGFVEFLKKTNH